MPTASGASDADIGAQALVELPDGSFPDGCGRERNEVYRYDKKAASASRPFVLDAPVIDMAVDAVGQLLVMTVRNSTDSTPPAAPFCSASRVRERRPAHPSLDIAPQTGEIYVPRATVSKSTTRQSDPAKTWRHFSNQRVGDLASQSRTAACGRQDRSAIPGGL